MYTGNLPYPREGSSAADLYKALMSGWAKEFEYNGQIFDVENVPRVGFKRVIHRATGRKAEYQHRSMTDFQASAANILAMPS